MQRFFLPPESFQGQTILFPKDISHQIKRVLRMQNGQQVIVLNNKGYEFDVELDETNTSQISARIINTRAALGEPDNQITLYISLTQREKFEWVLQKCTEVGVNKFVPLITSRTLLKKNQEAHRKVDRWRRIIREAAEQCERGRIPVLAEVLQFDALAVQENQADLRLMLWASEDQLNLKDVLNLIPPSKKSGLEIELLIGPEGGFSSQEVLQAQENGFKAVSMGKRILRMETAAVAAVTAVLYHMGDLSL